jgi:hypothetical protein
VGGSCEHGIEPSGSIKCWEVLEWLHSWRLEESCTVLVLSCPIDESSLLPDESLTGLQSSSNPLKVALRVPSRGHSRTVYFPYCHSNISLVAAGTKVYLAVDWQWTSILNAWGTCLSMVAEQLTVPAGCHVNVSTIRYLGSDICRCSGFTCVQLHLVNVIENMQVSCPKIVLLLRRGRLGRIIAVSRNQEPVHITVSL